MLAWLLAPEAAYNGGSNHKTNLQDSTCNWYKACAVRDVGSSDARLFALATIAALAQPHTYVGRTSTHH
jgi:hypothetical protein